MSKQSESDLGPQQTGTTASTYSLRLDGKLRENIERAAKHRHISMGRFVREAAAYRATDVLNADIPQNRTALQLIASKVCNMLLNPRVRLIGELDGRRVEAEIDYRTFESFLPDDPTENIALAAFYWAFEKGRNGMHGKPSHDEIYELAEQVLLKDVVLLPMEDHEKNTLRDALRQAGTEFTLILAEALAEHGREPTAFIPTLNADTLLSRDEEASD